MKSLAPVPDKMLLMLHNLGSNNQSGLREKEIYICLNQYAESLSPKKRQKILNSFHSELGIQQQFLFEFSDRKIVEAFKREKESLFRIFMSRYKKELLRYTEWRMKDSFYSEQIVHDVLLLAVEKCFKLEKQNLRSWLRRVASNECYKIDYREKKVKELTLHPETEEDFETLLFLNWKRETYLIEYHWENYLYYIIKEARLTPLEKEVISLLIEGYSEEGVADKLGKTEKNIRGRKSDALKKVRAVLSDEL